MTSVYRYNQDVLGTSRRGRVAQKGGNPAAVMRVLSTVNEVGQKIKPATKIGNFMDSHFSEKTKKKVPYKIVKGIMDFGKSIGWGGGQMHLIVDPRQHQGVVIKPTPRRKMVKRL